MKRTFNTPLHYLASLLLLLTVLHFTVFLILWHLCLMQRRSLLPEITRIIVINPILDGTDRTRHHLPHGAFGWLHSASAGIRMQEVLHVVSSKPPLLHGPERNDVPLLHLEDQAFAILAPAVVAKLTVPPQSLARQAPRAAQLADHRRLKYCLPVRLVRGVCHQRKVRCGW